MKTKTAPWDYKRTRLSKEARAYELARRECFRVLNDFYLRGRLTYDEMQRLYWNDASRTPAGTGDTQPAYNGGH